jgi:stearoyl-CoA 9-desaturase NADPH oxidoreductase
MSADAGFFGTLATRLSLDRQLDFWLGEVDPVLSLREVRARITDIVEETPDAKTFVLWPSRRWPSFAAGQYVTIDVETDGVRRRRCYSISSAPSEGRSFTITVKRVTRGCVSNWLHDRARIGDAVVVAPAAGAFVLPDPIPRKLLFMGAGSGITPIFSLLLELANRRRLDDVALLHYAPTRDDVIFHDRLVALAEEHRGFRLAIRLTRGFDRRGRFSEGSLRSLVPDFADRETFLCGPPPLMAEVERLWAQYGLLGRLRRERFVPPMPLPGVASGEACVTLLRSGRSFVSDGSGTLLEQAERAGARPAYGCRRGICHSCRCRKKSGTVQNVLTGEVSSAPDQDIQLCIAVARSDVELSI